MKLHDFIQGNKAKALCGEQDQNLFRIMSYLKGDDKEMQV